mmetsp:Transcript_30887/g.51117  ORF Transcript_30887/g.51117 Transcript_30887/m.51117 type:complete len:113 (+) Transcript_30887:234-572(+)
MLWWPAHYPIFDAIRGHSFAAQCAKRTSPWATGCAPVALQHGWQRLGVCEVNVRPYRAFLANEVWAKMGVDGTLFTTVTLPVCDLALFQAMRELAHALHPGCATPVASLWSA